MPNYTAQNKLRGKCINPILLFLSLMIFYLIAIMFFIYAESTYEKKDKPDKTETKIRTTRVDGDHIQS